MQEKSIISDSFEVQASSAVVKAALVNANTHSVINPPPSVSVSLRVSNEKD